jgi:hypothetical protein
MFVLLPLFALFVGWFYNRRKYYYTQHAIFSIHFHSFYFLIFPFLNLLSFLLVPDISVDTAVKSPGKFAWEWSTPGILALLLTFVYLVAALKNVYRQSLWLSLLKAIAISILYIISIILAFGIIAVIAFLRG